MSAASIEELGGECFVVRDASGQALSYVYFDDDSHLREVSKRLTSDEARRIAANIARLPDLLQQTVSRREATYSS